MSNTRLGTRSVFSCRNHSNITKNEFQPVVFRNPFKLKYTHVREVNSTFEKNTSGTNDWLREEDLYGKDFKTNFRIRFCHI